MSALPLFASEQDLQARAEALASMPAGIERARAWVESAWLQRQRSALQAEHAASDARREVAELPDLGEPERAALMARLDLAQAEVDVLQGRWGRAKERCRQVLETAAAQADALLRGDARWVLATLALTQGNVGPWKEQVDPALADWQQAGEVVRTRLVGIFHRISHVADQAEQVRQWLQQALQQTPEHPLEPHFLALLSARLDYGSGPGQAAVPAWACARALGEAGWHSLAAHVGLRSARLWRAAGDVSTAQQCVEQVLSWAEAYEWWRLAAEGLALRGEMLAQLGQVHDAADALTRAQSFLQGQAVGLDTVVLHHARGRFLLGCGDTEGAIEALQEAVTGAQQCSLQGDRIDPLISLGLACARGGKWSQALEALQAAEQAVQRFQVWERAIALHHAWATVHQLHGFVDPVNGLSGLPARRAHLKAALEKGRSIQGWVPPAPLLLDLAELEGEAGDVRQSMHWAREAVKAEQHRAQEFAEHRTASLRLQHESERTRAAEVFRANIERSQSQTASVLTQLGHIGTELTATLDLDEVFAGLHRNLQSLLDAPALMIWMLHESGEYLELRFGIEYEQQLPRLRIDMSSQDARTVKCIRTQSEVLLEIEPDGDISRTLPGTAVMYTALFGPLMVGQTAIGVLSIQSPRVYAYQERERLIFKSLCAFGAVALSNSQSYQRMREAQAQVDAHAAELSEQLRETERMRAEVQRSEARYRGVMENIREAVVVYSGGPLVFANQQALTLTGYSRDEFMGLRYDELVHPDDAHLVRDWVYGLIKGTHDGAIAPTFRIVRKDGELRWLSATGAPCLWDGQPAQVCVYSDVTEAVSAQQWIKVSEERYRGLVESISEAICICVDQTIVFANARAVEFRANASNPLVGQPFLSCVHPEDVDLVRPWMEALAVGEVAAGSRCEFRWQRPDGKLLWVEASGAVIDWNGQMALMGVFNDLTSRRLAEQELREAHERNNRLLGSVDAAVVLFDAKYALYVNQGAQELSGYSAEEFLARPWLEFVHPNEQELVGEAAYQLMLGTYPTTKAEFRLLHKSGRQVWTEARFSTGQWRGERVAIGVFTDQTQRKEAEQALQLSEQGYRSVIDGSTDLVLIFDHGQTVYVNQRACDATGYTEQEILSVPYMDLVHPDDREATAEWAYERVYRNGAQRHIRLRVLRKDGSVLHTQTSMAMCQWQGRPAVACIYSDLTEQIAREEAQRQHQAVVARLFDEVRTVFDHAPVGMMLVADERILRVNGLVSELFGRSTDSMVGEGIEILFTNEEVRSAYEDKVRPAMQATGSGSVEVQFDRADGRRIWIQLSATLASIQGYERSAIAVVEDISERKRLEDDVRRSLRDALHAKEQADAASRAKSEFLAMMSHEIRTPIAGVIGMQGFALRDDDLRGKTRQQLELAQSSAKSLLTILNDVLDFSKIEAGKLKIEEVDFSLRALVTEAVALLGDRAAGKSLVLDLTVGPDVPDFVRADPTRIRQVMVNLIGNALKFTDLGSVHVRVSLQGVEEGLHRVCFEVEDTGIGMSEEAMARLFQKFEQADASTTRRYGGTGLGLAISRQLVELMQGRIWVRSQIGKGSVFAFELPLPLGQAVSDDAHQDSGPHSHQLKILCAEDFPTNQVIIRTLLEDMGHEVYLADNGLLAVQALSGEHFDLILMDGRMPEMDGAMATRTIRQGGTPEYPVRQTDIPIIALTANASEEDRRVYLDSGMNDFLSKPIDESQLHLKLKQVIDRLLAQGAALPAQARTRWGDALPREALDRWTPPRATDSGAAPVFDSHLGWDAPETAPTPAGAQLDALFGVAPSDPPPAAATAVGSGWGSPWGAPAAASPPPSWPDAMQEWSPLPPVPAGAGELDATADPAAAAPGLSGLDALFGVDAGAAASPPLASAPSFVPSPAPVPRRPTAPAPKVDLKTRMRQAFAQDMPARMAELSQALSQRDAAAAARLFHGFKGSAAYLEPGGELHVLCGDLEKAADRQDWPPVDEAWPRLQVLLKTYANEGVST
jgi:PAS domain S-box-containing protein